MRDAFAAVALVPLVIAGAMFIRAVWASRSVRDRGGLSPIRNSVIVFAAALVLNGWLLFAYIWPLYRPLDEGDYLAALNEEAGRGEIKQAAALARVALDKYPTAGALSAVGTAVMFQAGDCDGLRQHFDRPGAMTALPMSRPSLLTLARAGRVCGLSLKEHPDAARLIEALRDRADLWEERELLQLELGFAPGMGADFRKYARAAPARSTIREDTSIEGMTTRFGDKGGEEFTVYFRPLSDWQGRRLWVHAYPPGSQEYIDIGGDFPAFNGWKKDAWAWEVFQTPDDRAFNIYVGVAVGDDLGPALPLGVIGGR